MGGTMEGNDQKIRRRFFDAGNDRDDDADDGAM
jgi:hypothetical protein